MSLFLLDLSDIFNYFEIKLCQSNGFQLSQIIILDRRFSFSIFLIITVKSKLHTKLENSTK